MSLLSIHALKVHIPVADDFVLRAIDGLSFDIQRSEVFGLVGESGCGKSMTSLAIMGLLPAVAGRPDGEVIFEGNNLLLNSDSQMRRIRGNKIAMVFQEPMTSLNPVFTVGYQIAELLITHKGFSKRKALDRAVELLEVVKVPSPGLRVKQYPHQMSGGMRQRVMIAMALACDPALIIADEPTTALDVTIQAQILELLEDLRQSTGTSMLFITHELGIVAEISQRVMVMYAGAAIEQAPAVELFERPLHPYTQGLLESLPGKKGQPLKPIPGALPTAENFPPGCRFEPRCRYRVDECRQSEPEFQEIKPGHLVRCLKAGDFL